MRLKKLWNFIFKIFLRRGCRFRRRFSVDRRRRAWGACLAVAASDAPAVAAVATSSSETSETCSRSYGQGVQAERRQPSVFIFNYKLGTICCNFSSKLQSCDLEPTISWFPTLWTTTSNNYVRWIKTLTANVYSNLHQNNVHWLVKIVRFLITATLNVLFQHSIAFLLYWWRYLLGPKL